MHKSGSTGALVQRNDRLNAQSSNSKRGNLGKSEQLLKIVDNLSLANDTKKKDFRENLNFYQIYLKLSCKELVWEEEKRKRFLDRPTE